MQGKSKRGMFSYFFFSTFNGSPSNSSVSKNSIVWWTATRTEQSYVFRMSMAMSGVNLRVAVLVHVLRVG